MWTFVRTEVVLVAALAVIAFTVLAFAGIADEMSEGDAHAFDMAVLQALHSTRPTHPIRSGRRGLITPLQT